MKRCGRQSINKNFHPLTRINSPRRLWNTFLSDKIKSNCLNKNEQGRLKIQLRRPLVFIVNAIIFAIPFCSRKPDKVNQFKIARFDRTINLTFRKLMLLTSLLEGYFQLVPTNWNIRIGREKVTIYNWNKSPKIKNVRTRRESSVKNKIIA